MAVVFSEGLEVIPIALTKPSTTVTKLQGYRKFIHTSTKVKNILHVK
jgi:hypothetical protein